MTVQLVDASDGSVQWSQASRFRLESVLEAQEEICGKIVDELPLATESAGALR